MMMEVFAGVSFVAFAVCVAYVFYMAAEESAKEEDEG